MISWSEPACLVRAVARRGDEPARQIVIEASFVEVARVFGRYRTDEWADLTISFPERMSPPFRYEAGDFERHVLGRLLALDGA